MLLCLMFVRSMLAIYAVFTLCSLFILQFATSLVWLLLSDSVHILIFGGTFMAEYMFSFLWLAYVYRPGKKFLYLTPFCSLCHHLSLSLSRCVCMYVFCFYFVFRLFLYMHLVCSFFYLSVFGSSNSARSFHIIYSCVLQYCILCKWVFFFLLLYVTIIWYLCIFFVVVVVRVLYAWNRIIYNRNGKEKWGKRDGKNWK